MTLFQKHNVVAKYLTQTQLLFKIITVFIFLLLTTLIGCNGKPAVIHWNYSDVEVVGPNLSSNPSSINIDIYVDATTSMKGFAVNPNSIYNKFLDELEASVGSSWSKTELQFFKFGTKIKPIDRNGFLAAKTQPFYAEPGIFEKTNIDAVIDKTDASRVSVVITDLFQSEGDVNAIVLQIKDKCFTKNVQFAVLGIKSDYDGKIYDAKVLPYPFKSTSGDENTYRPFYALIFGDPANIEHLFESLKSKPFVKEENLLILPKYVIKNFDTVLAKTPDSKGLQPKNNLGRNQFYFLMFSGSTSGTLKAEITFERNSRTPDFLVDKLELEVYKKVALMGQQTDGSDPKTAQNNGEPTQDITLKEIKRDGNKISAILNLAINGSKGTYSYHVYLKTPAINGFLLPQWVKDFSSENPSPQSDSNKTLNFEKFISDSIRADLSIYQPKVANMYITIEKR